jgi:(2R)-ethylmalonyl-CoA mutase
VAEKQIERLNAWRAVRDDFAVKAALDDLAKSLAKGGNIMDPSIVCAKAGVTTGEWSDCLRQSFGNYRAPTGISNAASANSLDVASQELRAAVNALASKLGRPFTVLIGKPGLDGHSNGAEQIAVKARDIGMKVIYGGIRHTPDEIVESAKLEDVHLIGLSIMSGSHIALVSEVMKKLREEGVEKIPVVVGGIIPATDQARLTNIGVARVYTPKDFELNKIMRDFVALGTPTEPLKRE